MAINYEGKSFMEQAPGLPPITQKLSQTTTYKLVVATQLAERSLLIPDVHSSSPVVGKFFIMNIFSVSQLLK